MQKVEYADRAVPYISFAEIQYLIFGIPSNDYHNELYGAIQNKFSKMTIKSCDKLLIKHRLFSNADHYKPTNFTNPVGGKTYNYFCISTWIRNEINHPLSSGRTFNEPDLQKSIEFMRGILIPSINNNSTINIDGSYEFDSDLNFEEYSTELDKGSIWERSY